jgi:hypothetical protein
MPNPSAKPTPVTPPRVPIIDPKTGLIDRAWYMFFLSLFTTATEFVDSNIGPSTESLLASYDAELRALEQNVQTKPQLSDSTAELQDLAQVVKTQPLPLDLSEELESLGQAFATQPSRLDLIAELQELEQMVATQPTALDLTAELEDLAQTVKTQPTAIDLTAELEDLAQTVATLPQPIDTTPELIKQIETAQLQNLCLSLLSQVAELQKQIDGLQSQPNATTNNFYGPVAYVEDFVGTGSQTVFTLISIPIGINAIQVYINGVYQEKNTYTLVDATLTFSEAPPYTASIEVLYV